MDGDLTAAEQQFFETGELPPELASQITAPAPAPEPAPAPAPIPAPVPAPSEAPPIPPIDLTAELRTQLEAERRSRSMLEQRFSELSQKIGQLQPKPPEDAPPDPNKDPLGAMLHQLDKITQSVNGLQQRITQTEQQTLEQKNFSDFVAGVKSVRDEFAKTTPDFYDAYKHLREARAADLRDVGVPEDKINEALLQDEIAVSQNAVQQGKNPAQVIYNMAKRYGYNGVRKPATPTPAEKLAQVHAGTQAAIAPPKAGSDAELTFAGLKDASDADLNRLTQNDDLWHKLVGNTSKGIF